MVIKTIILSDLKRWTIYNAESQKIQDLTDQEFKNLLDIGGVKLKGDYILVNIEERRCRIWVDGILNSQYFK